MPNICAARTLALGRRHGPIVTAKDIETELGVATPTANRLIQDLVEVKAPGEITGQPRYRLFVFDRYLTRFVS